MPSLALLVGKSFFDSLPASFGSIDLQIELLEAHCSASSSNCIRRFWFAIKFCGYTRYALATEREVEVCSYSELTISKVEGGRAVLPVLD